MFTDHEHYQRLKAMAESRQQTWDLSPNDVAAITWALKAIDWSERAWELHAAKIEQLNLDTQRLIGRSE